MNVFEELAAERAAPIPILHGTDWWTDCDDVAALRLLLRAHRAGLIRLLGIGIDSVMEFSAPSVSAFCTDEGLEIPIGIDPAAVRDGRNCRYQAVLAGFPHRVESNAACPDAVALYRGALAALPGKAVITEVGFPTILSRLLKSPPDGLSPLTGTELVREKVERMVLMAGKWDVPRGCEYNLSAYPACAEAGAYLCENSPVPITFLGFECGVEVISGDRLPHTDLLYRAFEAHGSAKGRCSWDPLTVLAAIVGDMRRAGYETVRGFARVDPQTGENSFTEAPDGPHAYLVPLHGPQWYADRLNALY